MRYFFYILVLYVASHSITTSPSSEIDLFFPKHRMEPGPSCHHDGSQWGPSGGLPGDAAVLEFSRCHGALVPVGWSFKDEGFPRENQKMGIPLIIRDAVNHWIIKSKILTFTKSTMVFRRGFMAMGRN